MKKGSKSGLLKTFGTILGFQTKKKSPGIHDSCIQINMQVKTAIRKLALRGK